MDVKKPFVTLEQLQDITRQYPTPFHLYDERGIRGERPGAESGLCMEPRLYGVLRGEGHPQSPDPEDPAEEGCGVDCSSLCELMMSDRCGFRGGEIMFSSNDTPAEEFVLAEKLGATINLDDITHVEFLKSTLVISPKRSPAGIIQVEYSRSERAKRAFRSWTTGGGQVRHDPAPDRPGLPPSEGAGGGGVRHPRLPGLQHPVQRVLSGLARCCSSWRRS